MFSLSPRKGSSIRTRFNRQSKTLNLRRQGCEALESRTLMSAGLNSRLNGLSTAADILPIAATAQGDQTLKAESQKSFATTLRLAQGFDPFGQGVVTGPLVVLTGRTAPFALVRLDMGADGTFEQQVRAGAQGRFLFATNVGAGLTPFQVVATNRLGRHSSTETSVYRFDTAVAPGLAQRGGITTLTVSPSLDLSRHGVVSGPDVILVGHTIPRSRLILKAAGVTETTYADTAGDYRFSLSVARGMTLVQVDATGPGGRHTRAHVTLFRVDTTNSGGDKQPPVVVIQNLGSGLLTNQNPTLTGQVTDNASGVASLQEQVDSGAFVTVPIDSSGHFNVTTALSLDGMADGSHSAQFRAVDKAGNVSPPIAFSFTLDTRPPTVTVAPSGTLNTSPTTLTVAFSEPTGSAAFQASGYALTVSGGANNGQTVAIASVTPIDAKTVLITLAAPPANAGYKLTVPSGVTDLAGNRLTVTAAFPFTVAQPVGIASFAPAGGEEMVSVARPIVVNFNGVVDPKTVTSASLTVIANGSPVTGKLRVSSTNRFVTFLPDSPLPASTEVRIAVDGTKIKDPDGLAIDASGIGLPGTLGSADFTTLPLTRITGTDVFGYVYDSYNKNPDGTNIPIVGATVRVDALPGVTAVTDSKGYFILKDMPAPSFFVHVDGTTAAAPTAGTMYPSVGKEFMSIPGQTVQLTMDGNIFNVYLPPMTAADMIPLSTTKPTVVGFGAGGKAELAALLPGVDPSVFDAVKVTFEPGSAIDRAGNPATMGAIIPVPPNRLPAPLPPGQNPKLVISIQALGPNGQPLTNPSFDKPASVSFPNLDGLKPGEKSFIWSFNHDAGRWDIVGTGTVSADGKTIVSDGAVIRAPGWHFTASGSKNGDKLQQQDQTKNDYANTAELIKEYKDSGYVDDTGALTIRGSFNTNAAIVLARARFLTTSVASGYFEHYLDNSGTALGADSPLNKAAANEFLSDANFLSQVVAADKNAILAKAQATPKGMPFHVDLTPHTFKLSTTDLSFALSRGDMSFKSVEGSGTVSEDGTTITGGQLVYTGTLSYGYGFNDAFSSLRSGSTSQSLFFRLRALQLAGQAQPFTTTVVVTVPLGNSAKSLVRDTTQAMPAESQLVAQSEPSVSTATGFGTDPSIYYRFVLASGFEIPGKTDKLGNLINVVFPANTRYTGTFYSPSNNMWTSIVGVSGPSGEVFGLDGTPSSIILDHFGGLDTDGDGIPDIGELAIGTDPNKFDTNGDGISDSSAITQGLNPLGSSAFPTGVIASLPLAGPAQKVTVADDKVYVVTGGHGLAVVDGSKFNQPIVLGQIDLGGTPSDVGVDSTLKIAAVATGQNLVLVDVSDPMTPKVKQSVTIAADKVIVANGLAYVSSVTSLRIVDLKTGSVIQGLTLPGSGNITDLAREGSKLYAFVNGSNLLVVVDISKEAEAAVVGQVNVSASGDVGVFAGNGVVWLTSTGLITVDVSDPTKPTVTHGADSRILAHRLALNGSGIGLLAPGSGTTVEVYDTSDPNKTGAFLTRFDLGATANSVAISRGIGYVGTSTGLQVINYLPFDTKGKAPTVAVVSDAVDLDPKTPGIQVVEGGSIPIRVNISDDVQVRDVQLIVDGKVVSDAVSFPFNFSAVALAGTTGAKSVTIQAKATDTGGNSTLSAPVVIQLVPDTFPPTIVSIDPPDGSVRGKGTTTLRARFSEPLDPSKFKPGTFTLVEAGADGKFGTKDDVSVPIKGVEARDNNTLVQITTDPIPIGSYQIRVNAPDVTDRFNNPLGTKVVTSAFTVKNFVPVTINFNAGSGSPRSYTESGLSITSGQDHLHMGDQNGDGSPDLLNHSSCCSTPYTFTFGGQPFSVLSMDVVGGSGIGSGTFTSSTGAISKPTTKGTFTFDANGWTNITSFTWDQPIGDFIIDNLVLAVVPGSGGSISSASIVAALSRSEQAARQGNVVDATIAAMDDEGVSNILDLGSVPAM